MIASWDDLPDPPAGVKVKQGWPSREEKETAARLGVDLQQLRRARAAGLLPPPEATPGPLGGKLGSKLGSKGAPSRPPTRDTAPRPAGKDAPRATPPRATPLAAAKASTPAPTRAPLPDGFNPFRSLSFGPVLTPEEASTFRPVVIECLTQYTDWLDDGISHTNRKRTPAVIWSSMDDSEITVLADALLTYARKHAAGALFVRKVVVGWSYVRVGLIIAPRFFATMQFYAENGGFALLAKPF